MDPGTRTPPLHRRLDMVSGALLLFLTVWAPWTFAGTVWWASWTLTGLGGVLGALLLAKHVVRWRTGYAPARWVNPTPTGRWVVRGLAVLSLVILEYLLVSWLNARASLLVGHRGVDLMYRSHTPWSGLPTTYDAPATLRALTAMTSLTLVFWSARDWLLGRSRHERHADEAVSFPPARLRRLLWTLCISSGVLAVVSIAQRLDGTDRLLWMRRIPIPWQLNPVVPNPSSQSWGPFPSRANGAAYFNLVWPVALGFWWALQRSRTRSSAVIRRIGSDASVMLLPGLILMMACPLLAGSRTGAVQCLGLMGVGLLSLAVHRSAGLLRTLSTLLGVILLLVLPAVLFPTPLQRVFQAGFEESLSNRAALEAVTQRMAGDAGVLGTGAGSYTGLYALYRSGPDEPWMAHAHNDWMESRITLGLFGTALLLGALGLLVAACRSNRGLRAPREFLWMLGASLAAGLMGAFFEYPLQVPALAFLFILLAAVGLATAGSGKDIIDG
ncbi:MAG: O-antigen ligase family protein [Verrucomicrobiales bacterium]|nr:O-antigen ligase family protein [Verrucomicrobiales bacterium]